VQGRAPLFVQFIQDRIDQCIAVERGSACIGMKVTEHHVPSLRALTGIKVDIGEGRANRPFSVDQRDDVICRRPRG